MTNCIIERIRQHLLSIIEDCATGSEPEQHACRALHDLNTLDELLAPREARPAWPAREQLSPFLREVERLSPQCLHDRNVPPEYRWLLAELSTAAVLESERVVRWARHHRQWDTCFGAAFADILQRYRVRPKGDDES